MNNILITGASGYVGSAFVRLFANSAKLYLLDINENKLEDLCNVINFKFVPSIIPFDLMTLNEDNALELLQNIDQLDCIIHSAMYFKKLSPLSCHSLHDWQNTMQVNLTSPFLLTKTLLPLLQESDMANIIFNIDKNALQDKNFLHSYKLSNIAVQSMCALFADENAYKNIKYNSLIIENVISNAEHIVYPFTDKSHFKTVDEKIVNFVEVLLHSQNGETVYL